jgi:hypothetical protein
VVIADDARRGALKSTQERLPAGLRRVGKGLDAPGNTGVSLCTFCPVLPGYCKWACFLGELRWRAQRP